MNFHCKSCGCVIIVKESWTTDGPCFTACTNCGAEYKVTIETLRKHVLTGQEMVVRKNVNN